jgi:hypothetical protein
MRSRMSAHSDLSDTNSDDESHTLSHRRCADTITSTVFPTNSGTTIYSVASNKTGSVARQYRKRVLNQHRLIYKGDIWMFISLFVYFSFIPFR